MSAVRSPAGLFGGCAVGKEARRGVAFAIGDPKLVAELAGVVRQMCNANGVGDLRSPSGEMVTALMSG